MSIKQEYYKSLQDNKWKVKRQEILKRDNYKCTVCGSAKDLAVHHQYYYSNKFLKAWEYPNDCLITVCSECHEKYHQTCEVLKKKYFRKPKQKKKKKKKQQKQTVKDWSKTKIMKDAMKVEREIKNKYKK